MKFGIWVFSETLLGKFKILINLLRTTGTSHGDQYTFFISPSVRLRMKKYFRESFRESQNAHCTLNNLFRKSCRLWDNVETFCRAGRPQTTTRCMHIAVLVPKATNAHSEFVLLIAFPLQQWLNELGPVLHYPYIATLLLIIYFMHFVYFECALRPACPLLLNLTSLVLSIEKYRLWDSTLCFHSVLLLFPLS
jgi:hypothetical protein